MVNTTYYSTEKMINKLQELKGKTILKFYKKLSKYYDNMNIRMDEDPCAKNAQKISKIYQEVLLLMKFLQTKPEAKNMNISYYDLYHTVIENRKEEPNKFVTSQYENDFNSLKDVIISNLYVGRKDREKRYLK